jgi:outer membrane receptor protein involved in Fe transport
MCIDKAKHSLLNLIILLIMVLPPGVYPQEQKKIDKYFKMDLYELLGKEMTTAGLQEEKISEIPASVVLVTREDIERYGYTSLEEILENIPGLYLIDDYNWLGTKNFGVRGFFSTGAFDNMIVLINGVNQVEKAFDSYFTEKIAVPVEAIDRIEVIRGPMSVIYGSGAFFGAINIITHDITDKTPTSILSTSIGDQKTKNIFARISGRKGDFRYSFNASIYENGGIDEPFSKMMTDASIVTRPVEEGGWNLDTDRTGGLLKTKRKYLNFFGKFNDFSFALGVTNSEKNVVESIVGAGDGSFAYLNTAHASIKYEKKISDLISFSGKFSYSHDNHWVDDEFYFENSYTNNIIRLNSYEIEADAFINPHPGLNITLGLYRHTSSFFAMADYIYFSLYDLEVHSDNITTHAFFSQINFKLSKKFKLVAGIRLEKPEDYKLRIFIGNPGPVTFEPPFALEHHHKPSKKIEIIPRVAFIYSLNDKNIFKFLFGKAIKQPALSTGFDLVITPGPPLKAAEIQTYEFNYIAALSPNLLLNISIFRNVLKNLISRTNVLDPEAGEVNFISTNAGKMSTTGIELGIQTKIGKNLKLDLNGSYYSSKNKREGFENIDLGYSPKILGYAKASYTFSKDIIFAVIGRYVDKMETEWNLDNLDINNHPILDPNDPYKGRLGYEVGSYFTLDVNLRADRLFKSGLYLNVRVLNLLNEEIHYPATTSNPQFDKGTLGYTRSFIISLGYKF